MAKNYGEKLRGATFWHHFWVPKKITGRTFFGPQKNYGEDLLGEPFGGFLGGAAEDCPRATQGLKGSLDPL